MTILYVQAGTVSLDGLAVTNGAPAIHNVGGALTVTGCTFTGNTGARM